MSDAKRILKHIESKPREFSNLLANTPFSYSTILSIAKVVLSERTLSGMQYATLRFLQDECTFANSPLSTSAFSNCGDPRRYAALDHIKEVAQFLLRRKSGSEAMLKDQRRITVDNKINAVVVRIVDDPRQLELENNPPPPPLIPEQVEAFSRLAAQHSECWIGASPRAWAASFTTDPQLLAFLSAESLSRTQLFELWRNQAVPTEACFLSTMAWGGMRRNHGAAIWQTRNEWLPVCQDIRQGRYSRRQGFELFYILREQGHLPGMGPAYFTKLLFFGMPTRDGYILDQWTARSVHLLTRNRAWPRVQIDRSSLAKATQQNGRCRDIRAVVTDGNTGQDYERYCQLVEQIARQLSWDPIEVEKCMFGIGGRTPSRWREYVMENWYDVPEN